MPVDKRPGIPLAEKREAMERAGGLCEKCRNEHALNLHHVIPYAIGGQDTADNLCVLCEACHKEWHALESFANVPFDEWLPLPPLGILIALLRQPDMRREDISARAFRDQWMSIHAALRMIGHD